jgi:hypothetical protein
MHSRLSTQSIYYSKGKTKKGTKLSKAERKRNKGEKQGRKGLLRAKQRQRTRASTHTQAKRCDTISKKK